MKFVLKQRSPVLIILICLGSATFADSKKPEEPIACSSSREYITALEYLRDKKEYSLGEEDARRLAEKISSGCTGAAKRFIRVSSLLVKAELATKDAVETGAEFALKTDVEADTFIDIFLRF